MKNNITAVLNLQRPNKLNQYAVRIRTTISSVVSYYPAGFTVKKNQLLNGEVVNHPNQDLLNVALRKKVSDIDLELMQSDILKQDVTKLKRQNNITFREYAEKHIAAAKGVQSPGTIKQKNNYLGKFTAFNPHIKLKDIDKEVMRGFEQYCREKCYNNTNSVWTNTKFVKTILNAAAEEGIIQKSPGKGFKGAKYSDPKRITLSGAEIGKFEAFVRDPKRNRTLREVAAWFLFSVYTGLRYGDLSGFGGFINDRVLIKTEKTGEVVSIIATDQIKGAYKRLTKEIMSNQKMNGYLKVISSIMEIEKRVTCHLARHTFAVRFLEGGGDIFILSKIMGHIKLDTTQIYAKLANPRIDAEMARVFANLTAVKGGKVKKLKQAN